MKPPLPDTKTWKLIEYEAYLEATAVTVRRLMEVFSELGQQCIQRFGKVPSVADVGLPRSREEIQRVHDMLGTALRNPLIRDGLMIDPESAEPMMVTMEALCWVLGHPVPTMERNLLQLEQEIRELREVVEEAVKLAKEPVQ